MTAAKSACTAVTFSFTVNDATSMKGVADVAVKACARTDTTCAIPLATGTTDATGTAKLSVPSGPGGFDGYVDLSNAMFTPQISFLVSPATNDSAAYSTVLISKATFNLLQTVLGLTADAARGHVGVVAYDCAGQKAPGVSYAVNTQDGASVSAYFVNNFPTKTVTQTDSSGFGLIGNVPAGPAVVTASVSALGKVVGAPAAFVRAGTVTAMALPPLP